MEILTISSIISTISTPLFLLLFYIELRKSDKLYKKLIKMYDDLKKMYDEKCIENKELLQENARLKENNNLD